jgi:hypothetical protein
MYEGMKATLVTPQTAAGTSDVNSSAVDMADYDGVIFIAVVGAIVSGGVTYVKGQQGQVSDSSDMADLASSKQSFADTNDDGIIILDIYRPQERYVRAVFSRATQNSTIGAVIALQYGPKKKPVTQDTTVRQSKTLASPAEGTA